MDLAVGPEPAIQQNTTSTSSFSSHLPLPLPLPLLSVNMFLLFTDVFFMVAFDL